MIESYIILEAGTAHELVTQVNFKIIEGYIVWGSLSVINVYGLYKYTQVMVRWKQPV